MGCQDVLCGLGTIRFPFNPILLEFSHCSSNFVWFLRTHRAPLSRGYDPQAATTASGRRRSMRCSTRRRPGTVDPEDTGLDLGGFRTRAVSTARGDIHSIAILHGAFTHIKTAYGDPESQPDLSATFGHLVPHCILRETVMRRANHARCVPLTEHVYPPSASDNCVTGQKKSTCRGQPASRLLRRHALKISSSHGKNASLPTTGRWQWGATCERGRNVGPSGPANARTTSGTPR